ncbi:L-lactate dehydrogenase complex protein LldG [Brevibacterium paucivorans]|uniref:L-lactate dehydrogenase complex protein LldG n=1 Tax=Brevibacterium paucivorans TaxID=170994 RepID=A0ABS2SLG9_9MICO|nr:LUD domain-containing protein [Brevibacterium paucivorans]MBM7816143.1 L-lactate dehydrogenase complex protein LldG [Brevibacterium paucivorans]
MSRELILNRIYDALGRSPQTAPPASPTLPPAKPADPLKAETTSALVDLLTDRLVDYDATVTHANADTVGKVVAELLGDAQTVVIPHDLPEDWTAASTAQFHADSVEEPLSVNQLDSVDAVVTGSTVSIAETGTICLAGAATGRRAITLVPDHHVVVVKISDIVESVPQAVEVLVERDLDTAVQTWVSGPSATVDIELERVKGVHGPRTLNVVFLED